MQRNPGCKTIEAELEAAIHRAGGISDCNAGSFLKVVRPTVWWLGLCELLSTATACCSLQPAQVLHCCCYRGYTVACTKCTVLLVQGVQYTNSRRYALEVFFDANVRNVVQWLPCVLHHHYYDLCYFKSFSCISKDDLLHRFLSVLSTSPSKLPP